MKEYTQTLHVDAPPEKAFAAVVDPEMQQGRFMKVEVVKETSEGVGTTFKYYYKVLGKRLGGGTYSFSEYVPGRRFKWEFSAGGREMLLTGGPVASTWTFEPAEGGTDVTVRPEFETRNPVRNGLARGIMMWSFRTRSAPKFMAKVEKRAKS